MIASGKSFTADTLGVGSNEKEEDAAALLSERIAAAFNFLGKSQ